MYCSVYLNLAAPDYGMIPQIIFKKWSNPIHNYPVMIQLEVSFKNDPIHNYPVMIQYSEISWRKSDTIQSG